MDFWVLRMARVVFLGLLARSYCTLGSVCLSLAVLPLLQSAHGSSARFSLLPAGTVSDQIQIQPRLAIRNSAADVKNYTVEFLLGGQQERVTISSQPVTLASSEQVLVTSTLETTGLRGPQTVGYVVWEASQIVFSGESELFVVPSQTRALPRISAAWLDPGALLPGVYPQSRAPTESDLRRAVDALEHLGIETLVITYPEYILNGWGAFYPSSRFESALGYDVVGTILSQASQNGQRVFVGLGRGDDMYLTWNGFDDPERIEKGLQHSQFVASELWQHYSEEVSFYGWYLTHEANDVARASATYYNPMVDFLADFSAEKPVMVSPAGTPLVTKEILSASKVDIFAYQDAVGAGYVPYAYTYDPRKRIDQLAEVFSAYARAHLGTGKHLWANLELWQMDGPSYANAYPADSKRVLEQIGIEKNYVDSISAYEALGFLEDPVQGLLGGPAATELYAEYQAYLANSKPFGGWRF